MTAWLAVALLAGASAGPGAQKLRPRAAVVRLAESTTVNVSVSPSEVTFAATDPDVGTAAAPPTTVSWQADGRNNKNWRLDVSANGGGFPECPTVPASAVTVHCTGVLVTGTGDGSSQCRQPFTLTTAPQSVAGGIEDKRLATYQVILTFSLNESWRYIATTNPKCSLSVTYSVYMQ